MGGKIKQLQCIQEWYNKAPSPFQVNEYVVFLWVFREIVENLLCPWKAPSESVSDTEGCDKTVFDDPGMRPFSDIPLPLQRADYPVMILDKMLPLLDCVIHLVYPAKHWKIFCHRFKQRSNAIEIRSITALVRLGQGETRGKDTVGGETHSKHATHTHTHCGS